MNENYFHGDRVMKGHGLGSIFSSLFRRALPLFKLGGKYVGRKVLSTGMNVLDDVIEGDSFKKSLKRNLKTTSKDVINDVKNKMKGGKIRRRKTTKRKKKCKNKGNRKKKTTSKRKRKRKNTENSSVKRIKLGSGNKSLY